MSETAQIQIAIERVQDDEKASNLATDANRQVCHICQQSFKTDDIRTTFSCCHTLHHAECLSEWLVADRSNTGLPQCTRCKAAFYPNSFHYAMAQLATRSVQLRPLAETRAVSRIRLEVRPSVEEELYYNPATLLRRALRGENPTAAAAFHGETVSEQPTPAFDGYEPSLSVKSQFDGDRDYLWGTSPAVHGYYSRNDVHNPAEDAQEIADGSGDDSDYSSPYEDQEGVEQEPIRAAEVREWQVGFGRREVADAETATTMHVEDITEAATTYNPWHDQSTVVTAGTQADRQPPIRRNHWLYGRGHTILDAPEPSASIPDDTTALNDGFSLGPSVAEDDEFIPLYTHIHGLGQRLGQAPTPSSNVPSSFYANNNIVAPPATVLAHNPQSTQHETPASLYSFDHGIGNRLGSGEVNSNNASYLFRAGQGFGDASGAGWQGQMRAMGRFRHELGRGRTLGE